MKKQTACPRIHTGLGLLFYSLLVFLWVNFSKIYQKQTNHD